MWEAGEIGGGGREAYNAKKSYIFHNRKGLKGGRQEKKGQDPEMQGTGCGRYGPPVPPPPTTFQTWICCLFARYFGISTVTSLMLRSHYTFNPTIEVKNNKHHSFISVS